MNMKIVKIYYCMQANKSYLNTEKLTQSLSLTAKNSSWRVNDLLINSLAPGKFE